MVYLLVQALQVFPKILYAQQLVGLPGLPGWDFLLQLLSYPLGLGVLNLFLLLLNFFLEPFLDFLMVHGFELDCGNHLFQHGVLLHALHQLIEKLHFRQVELSPHAQQVVKLVSEVHADPWRMITEEEFTKKAEEIKRQARSPTEEALTIFDCYFYLQELAAAIQDGHTSIIFPIQKFTDTEILFPYTLKVIDNKAYAVEKWGEDPLPLYSEILKISHLDISTYREQSKKLANSSLGHIQDFIFGEYFKILFGLYFKASSPWEVQYKIKDKVQTVEVLGMSTTEYLTQLEESNTRYRDYSIVTDGKNIPVLDIPNFYYGSERNYQTFIDEFFKKIKKSEYLVLDLRENTGGNGTWGYFLLDYLTDSPFLITEEFTFKVSDTMRKSQYADKAGTLIKKAKNGEYLTIQKNLKRTPHEGSRKFDGQVFCLISEKTFSAGVVAAAIYKANRMGITVGQETSGRVKFCSDPVTKTLPHTKLEAAIPLAIYALPGEKPDRGVLPDFIVTRTIDDYQNGVDKEMEAVKDFFRKKR